MLTKPDDRGLRCPADNLIHRIPGKWEWFTQDDIMASLAPLPMMITEGGLTETKDRTKKAYQIMGAENNFVWYYYPKYSDPKTRHDYVKLRKD